MAVHAFQVSYFMVAHAKQITTSEFRLTNVPLERSKLRGVGVGQWSSLEGTEYLLHIWDVGGFELLLWRVIELFIVRIVIVTSMYHLDSLLFSSVSRSCSHSEEGAPHFVLNVN